MSVANPLRILTIAFFIGICVSSVNGLRCHKCESTNTPDCAINPSSELSSVECPTGETECMMAVLDDMVTYRGCKSAIQLPEDCQTCLNATCTGNLCNSGIYPEDRIKCHKCERGECVKVSGSPKPCVFYDKSDYCYVDVIDETDVIRGCVSDDDYDAGVYTKFCRSDGCNDAEAVSQFSCLSCDSDKDQNCKRNSSGDFMCKVNITNVCTVDVLYGRSESCFTYHDGQRVVRGCSRLEPQLMMQPEYITTCRSSECNDACIMNPMCYVCDSNEDDNCMENQSALVPQDCPGQTTSCYTCTNDDDSLTRGCGNDTTTAEGLCDSCSDTTGCNSKEIQVCYRCTSHLIADCATWYNDANLDLALCPGTCIVKVSQDGTTIRDCKLDDLKCDENALFCEECTDSVCNGGIFPKDRLQCFQCDGSYSFCDNEQFLRSYACPVFSSDDGCYQFIGDDGKMVRGCKSDQGYRSCQRKGDECFTCNTTNCNTFPITKQNSISCMVCDDDNECGWAQLSSKTCLSKIPFYQEPSCFTYAHENGIVLRGCSGDFNACDPSSDTNCETCITPGCNKANKIYQNCIQCSAPNGTDSCADAAQGIDAVRCPKDVQFFDKRGCYVLEQNGTVHRGCISDLDETTLNMCSKNDKSCKLCTTQSCNRQRLGNSGYTIRGLPYLTIVLLVLAMRFI